MERGLSFFKAYITICYTEAPTITAGASVYLILPIYLALISVCPKDQARNPIRRSAHLLTDCFQGYSPVAFDDQLIMHMTADEAMPQCFHGPGKDIPAYGLDDILDEFRSVAFYPAPLTGGHTLVGNTVTAELVLAHTGLNVAQAPA